MPYINHYSFHILDPDWGHVTIKISGHPPSPAQVILNGHEYVACQARKAGIPSTKEENCFRINCHHIVPIFFGKRIEVFAAYNSSIINQNIDVPKVCLRRLHNTRNCFAVRQVSFDR